MHAAGCSAVEVIVQILDLSGSPMSSTSLRAKAASARELLAGRAINSAADDSEDELHADIEPAWTWIYEDQSPHIIGARLGKFVLHVGSAVTLRADRNDVWVALITKFLDSSSDASADESDPGSEDEGTKHTKRALFTWLSSPREIRNPRHRRADCLPNELYATASSDVNPLEAIMGRATVVSPQELEHRYPGGKIPKTSPEFGKLFVCRRGANLRTATYTEEFKWGVDFMQGVNGTDEVEKLKQKVEEETVATRKRTWHPDDREGVKDFAVPHTPRKRRKLDSDDDLTSRSRAPKTTTPKRTPGAKFTTPTHRRIVEKKPLTFTPLGTRILDPTHSPYLNSPHALARTQLHVASVPASLPCRETEFSTVYTHLESAITTGTGSCIYISGTPGTGKTATVREVVAQLHLSVRAEELDDFIFVEINGMRLTDPHQSYSLLWEALTGSRVACGHALSLLTQEFGRPSPRRVPVVVLMDELDQLATRSQGVMYNFFQWPGLRHSRLIVLAVANTMDLPERTLSNKISSRLGLTRIVFQGYTHTQLMKIVETRLEAVPGAVVETDAVQFAARKVAGVSGDARRCLDICRRAVELAEQELLEANGANDANDENDDPAQQPDTPSKTGRNRNTQGRAMSPASAKRSQARGRVTIATIQRAIREATSSPLQQYLRTLPLASKLFLAALLALSRRSGISESTIGDVMDEAKKMAGMSGLRDLKDWLLTDYVSATPASHPQRVNGSIGEVEGTPKKRGRVAQAQAQAEAEAKASGVRKLQLPRVLGMSDAASALLEAGVLAVEERKGERAARCRILVGEEEIKGTLRGDAEVKGLGFDA